MEASEHVEKARSYFGKALETPQGSRLVNSISWSKTIKFVVDDIAAFHMNVAKGKLDIVEGDSENNDFWDVSRVYTDSETLNLILEGRKDSVDAQYEDEMIKVLPSGEYTQICFVHQLCRFAREEVLERLVNDFGEHRDEGQ